MRDHILNLMEKCEKLERYKIGIFINNKIRFEELLIECLNVISENPKWRTEKGDGFITALLFNGSRIDFTVASDDMRVKTYNTVIVDTLVDDVYVETLKRRVLSFYNFDTGEFEDGEFYIINFNKEWRDV